jgi:hypothetical protein
MAGEFNAYYAGSVEPPNVYDAVTVSTPFTHGGRTYIARVIVASADGTIDVMREDGTIFTGKQVVKGINVFRCIQVTNLGGLTLEWQA